MNMPTEGRRRAGGAGLIAALMLAAPIAGCGSDLPTPPANTASAAPAPAPSAAKKMPGGKVLVDESDSSFHNRRGKGQAASK